MDDRLDGKAVRTQAAQRSAVEQGIRDRLWRLEDGKAIEILKGSEQVLLEPPAVSADRRRLAVILRRDGKRHLHVLSADGGDLQSLAETIDIDGAACSSPDGQWIAAGGLDHRGPGLFKIPLDNSAPVRLIGGSEPLKTSDSVPRLMAE